MNINHIQLSKSRTVGVVSQHNKTKFRKIQITASGEVDKDEDPGQAYQQLSQFIESQFEYEKRIKQ